MDIDENNSRNIEAIKVFYDFQLKSLIETVNALGKGMTIYLLIVAGLSSYFITQEISPQIQKGIIIIAVIVSFLMTVASSSITWGIIKGLKMLETTLSSLDEKEFEKLKIEKFFKRGKVVGIIVFLSCLFVLLSFVTGMIILL